MLIAEILNRKGDRVVTVDARTRVAAAAQIMADEHVGAVVVSDTAGGLLGIVSEREIVKALATLGSTALSSSVERVMVTNGPSATLSDRVVDVMAQMTVHRARHVPVVSGGHIVGLVSIGDLVQSRLQEKIEENSVLQDMARARLLAA